MDATDSISVQRRWIEVSAPLRNGMVHWPGDPPFEISRVMDVGKGDHATLSRIAMGSHSGTHVDAPSHFIRGGDDVSMMPADTMVGPARVVEILDGESIKPDELVRHEIRRGERILFKTTNSLKAWRSDGFVEDYVYVSREAADYLSAIQVRMVGVDYLSVGP